MSDTNLINKYLEFCNSDFAYYKKGEHEINRSDIYKISSFGEHTRPYHNNNNLLDEELELDRIITQDEKKYGKCHIPEGEDLLESFDIYCSVLENNRKEFNFMELGAGYGRWAVHARNITRALKPNLKFYGMAIEGDSFHCRCMKTYIKDNNATECIKQIEGGVTTDNKNEYVDFGFRDDDELNSASWWGQSMVSFYYDQNNNKMATKIKAYALPTLLDEKDIWDLIDLDVQGSEAEILIPNKKLLTDKVKKIHIGTHSHTLEEELKEAFKDWIIVNDYYCGDYRNQKKQQTIFGEIAFGDGILTLKNSRFY